MERPWSAGIRACKKKKDPRFLIMRTGCPRSILRPMERRHPCLQKKKKDPRFLIMRTGCPRSIPRCMEAQNLEKNGSRPFVPSRLGVRTDVSINFNRR